MLIALILCTGLALWRWEEPVPRASGDTWQYTRLAYEYMGADKSAASTRARAYICRDWQERGAPPSYLAQCSKTGNGVARYNAIFNPRFGFPLAAVVLYPLFDDGAFAAATLAFAVVCGLLAFSTTLALRGGRFAALLAAALVYALPCGTDITRVMAEGAMFAGLFAAALGVALVLARQRHGFGAGVFALGLIWTFASKNSNGTAAAGAALVAAVVVLGVAMARRTGVRGPAFLAAVSLVVNVVVLAVTKAARFPTLNESLQDTFTSHYRAGIPDVADPWSRLLQMQRDVLIPYTQELAWGGLFFGALLLSAVVLLRWRSDVALFVLALGSTGAAVVAMHPVKSEIPRLALPLWIPIVLGLALAAHAALTPPQVATEPALAPLPDEGR